MAFDPDEFNVKPIGDAGLTERTVLDGSERILVQAGADEDVDITPMEFVKFQTIQALIDALQAKIDTLKGLGWADQTVKGNADAIAGNADAIAGKESIANVNTLKGTDWEGQTVKGNADDILLRENLSNKKSTLSENSETYYPNQKAVNDGLDTKTSKSEIAYNNDTSSFIANTLASGAIIERGSNANGEYVKFANGTMVCSHTAKNMNYFSARAYTGGLYQSAFSLLFPHSFLEAPNVSFGTVHYSASAPWIAGIAEPTSTTTCTFRAMDYGSSSSNTNGSVSYIAIGRWK